jgi:hypothetical protein
MQDETFKIRRYGKTELACIYYPALTPESAIKKFRRELKKNPKLRYMVDLTIHELSKPQVRQIIEELDEP